MRDFILYTIGYEGKDLDGFVSRVKEFHVERIVDVRELPLSRKRGFSKSALMHRLDDEGIEYVHLRELGSPRPLRNKLKQDGDYESFFREFSAHLEGQEAAIEEVRRGLGQATTCLMCFERLSETCHRSLVAEQIKSRHGNDVAVLDI